MCSLEKDDEAVLKVECEMSGRERTPFKQSLKRKASFEGNDKEAPVSRIAYCNFSKSEIDSRKSGNNTKITKEVLKEIGTKWQKMDRASRASFCKEDEVEGDASEGGQDQEVTATIKTRCAPLRFSRLVGHLSKCRR